MAAFRADLEADEPQRQATALLQLLNAVAGGRDVEGGRLEADAWNAI